jgi:hypothetical protein
VSFEVVGQTTAIADPGEGAFNDPALEQHDEAMEIRAFDDFKLPRAGRGDSCCHLGS